MAIEKFAYLTVRLISVAVGLVWVAPICGLALLARLQTHQIGWTVLMMAVALLFCVPNRWTNRGFLFWARLAFDGILGSFLIPASLKDIDLHTVVGHRPWLLPIPIAATLIVTSLVLPLSLLWRRRLDSARACSLDSLRGAAAR
jgi:hypothetical protein